MFLVFLIQGDSKGLSKNSGVDRRHLEEQLLPYKFLLKIGKNCKNSKLRIFVKNVA